ncbi:MAG: PIG-L family deacetylase [Gemmatimonadetes bacterium]|nr:PIG-L family deacetylase [Gemmatimonadota bacterium]
MNLRGEPVTLFDIMSRKRSILAVFAHPDDEAYGPGGTLAHYAMKGDAVHLLTFTRGEAGSLGVSKDLAPDELARLRTIELQAASDALGLSSHEIVGWPDSGLASMPFEEGVAIVGEALRRHEPDVLITFHREGVSRHPDHTTVYGWVVEAFARTDVEPVARVYGWGILEELCKPQRPERDMASIPADEIAARIPLSDEAYRRKVESIHSHVTQITFFDRLKEWFGDYRAVNDAEYFELAASRVPQPEPVVDDLFSGLPV